MFVDLYADCIRNVPFSLEFYNVSFCSDRPTLVICTMPHNLVGDVKHNIQGGSKTAVLYAFAIPQQTNNKHCETHIVGYKFINKQCVPAVIRYL